MAERRPSADAPPAKKAKREKVGVGVGVVVTKGRPRVADGTVSDFTSSSACARAATAQTVGAARRLAREGRGVLDCALRELREGDGHRAGRLGPADGGESKAAPRARCPSWRIIPRWTASTR